MTSINTQTRPTVMAAGFTPLLPKTAKVTIPAGLDGDIKTKINSVLARTLKGLYCTNSRPDDLLAIALILGPDIQDNAYTVKLHGYELASFYAFLKEQSQWMEIWWPGGEHPAFGLFLAQLKDLVGRVDTYASRPISGKS